MSETRRVELTTAPASQKQRKAARKHVTYRFHLILGESNPETCPEFSFTDFMKNEKPANGDPFEEPDEEKEVAALAQRFEAKYGRKVLQSGKKKRTQEIDDYYDPGGGYDEDDTFIDNTEAYDEIVPSSMTTQCGGFYINQGKLSFRNLNEDPHDFKQAKKRKKTSSLDAENEEEMGTALAKKYKSLKRKKQVDDKEGESKKVKLSNGKNSEFSNIKKKIKLKLKKLPPDTSSQKDVTTPSFLPPVAVVSLPATTADSGMVTASSKTVTSTTVNGAAETWAETSGKDELGTLEDIFSAVLRESITDDSSSKSEEEGKGENQMSEKNTQLPPQLPPELLEAIENMKKEAKESKEKKLKFFSSYINKLLLDIEIGSHKLPWGQKTAIYNHLGYHLPCGKHTLQRRAKKLRESQEEDQLKEPIQKLREAIMKVMPGLMEQHELHVQKAKMDAEIKEEVADVKEEVSTESEGEEKSDNRKKPRGPRRKFQWNSEIRDLLLSIVATKMKHYSSSKSRNQTAEEYLKAYLDSGIKPIWPQGWMQTRTLFKESKKAHEDMTRGTVQHNRQKKVQVGHDVTPSTLETSRPHISRTEDVMEVSSVMETCVGNKDTVIVNLPNSVASLPEMFQTTVHSLMSSSAGHLSKPSFRTNAITSQSNSVLPSSVTTAVSQKGLESPASFSAKSVISANSGPDITKVVSAEKNVTTKSFTPVNYPVTASGSRVPGSSSVAPNAAVFSNTSRSFMEAFDGFLKSNSLKSDLSSLSSDQQSFQKQKVSVLQQKSTIPQQQKLPQGVLNVTNSQQFKAAMRSPSASENKDIPNSSWTNMSSVVPASKSVTPVVISNHTPETQSQKFPAGLKNAQTLQQSQVISYQGNQQTKRPDLVLKNVTQKKQQTVGSSSSSTPIITTSESQLASKTGVTLMNVAMSSQQEVKKREQEQFQIVQNTSGQSNSQIKLGVVTDIPSSAQKLNAKHQIIRTGTVLSAGTLPQFATRSAADFTGWTSAKNAENVNMKQPLLSGKIVSSDASIVRPPQESAQHSKLPGSISSTTTSPSAPQSSGQSSQKMPEENTVLSAYEQIKTQMRQQEEIEGQALKNLAMALQFGGASNAGLFELDPKCDWG